MKRTLKYLLSLALLLGAFLPLTAARADGAGIITGDRVNLRSGPSTAYSRLTYLNRGDTVTVTGTSGNWYAAAFDSYKGYVHQNYVTLSGGAPSASPSGSTTLRYGSQGAQVKTLQGNLILLGYLSGSADGIYGSNTQAAVRKYQQRNGLSADGVAGAKTLSAIGAEVTRINTVVNTAKSFLGTPYVYGGSSYSGTDCSGFTMSVFAAFGYSLYHGASDQYAQSTPVSSAEREAGDLVFFNTEGGISHVGLYIGGGCFIHASSSRGVTVDSLSGYYADCYVGAGRLLP